MIREATSNDIESISDIIISAWQNAYEGIIDPKFPATMDRVNFIKIFKENFRTNNEKIMVYERDGEVRGFISGRLLSGNHNAEVVGLYVDPRYQGLGIGSRLLAEIQSYFRSLHCGNHIIWTLLNARNNDFYRKHGGIGKEQKNIEIGGVNYSGIGFVFSL